MVCMGSIVKREKSTEYQCQSFVWTAEFKKKLQGFFILIK